MEYLRRIEKIDPVSVCNFTVLPRVVVAQTRSSSVADAVTTASVNTKTELLIPARYGCLLGCLPAAERKAASLLVTVICLLVSCI